MKNNKDFKELENFYYKILNIKSNNNLNPSDIILDILSNIDEKFKVLEHPEGLCKVAAIEISDECKERGIESVIINLEDFGILYDHAFVIARFLVNNEILYYLIDATFSQFVDDDSTLNKKLDEWPAKKFLANNRNAAVKLLLSGYIKIDEQILSDYLDSFGEYSNEIESLGKLFTELRVRKI